VESQDPAVGEIVGLTSQPAAAHVIGITGPPGAGKSTATSALAAELRAAGRRVGILAVDPSSPFTGGALLGDRVRMQRHSGDSGVYIRSLATRGHLGGLAICTAQAIRLLEFAGFDAIVIETVGVGQSEVEIVSLAESTVVLLAPGLGDSIQASKAGVLEIGDIFVVNKSDREGADAVARDLRQMLALKDYGPGEWKPPITRTVASHGEGFDVLASALADHRSWLESSGALIRRRRARAIREIEALADAEIRRRWADARSREALGAAADSVASGAVDPVDAMHDYLAVSLRIPTNPRGPGRARRVTPPEEECAG
jgi:LAO/AO transport system kinase